MLKAKDLEHFTLILKKLKKQKSICDLLYISDYCFQLY